jgi:hypothetical protein
VRRHRGGGGSAARKGGSQWVLHHGCRGRGGRLAPRARHGRVPASLAHQPRCAGLRCSSTCVAADMRALHPACFPNVARFDYFDAPGEGSSRLHFRVRECWLCGVGCVRMLLMQCAFAPAQALDPIPQGTELLMSYFPISVPRAQRQLRLQTDYGFTCRRVRSIAVRAVAGERCGLMRTSCAAASDATSRSARRWKPGAQATWRPTRPPAQPTAAPTARMRRRGSSAARATAWSTRCGCSSFCARRRAAAARSHRPPRLLT